MFTSDSSLIGRCLNGVFLVVLGGLALAVHGLVVATQWLTTRFARSKQLRLK